MLNKKKNNKGFTLVELLVVIAIIGILAVVAVPALFKNINKAKVADVESDYSAIKSAVLSYYTDTNELPITTTDAPNKITKWNEKLAPHMDSVPLTSPLNGNYDLELDSKKLYLSITGANVTEEQLTKLTQDIGDGKVVVPTEEDGGKSTHNDYATVIIGGNSNVSTLVGKNVNIRLVLIENTDM